MKNNPSINLPEIKEAIVPCQGELLFDELLAGYTTWRVGGIAKCLYKPHDVDDLAFFLKQLPEKEDIIWLGLGSNCLIRDGGFSGTVIVTQGCLKEITLLDSTHVRVEAGVSCATMARFCARNNLEGAEFLAGSPGTMGGALRMNAGCSGGETWNHVVEVETMDRQGVRRTRTPADYAVAYRHVQGPPNEWFIAGTFELILGEKERALQKIRELLDHRAMTQPTSEYNCGSVFRNPPNNYAARLIEDCGLKGKQIGGAMVSSKHANFIINHEGAASAKDIETLIELVRGKVAETHAVDLIHEVHIIGEP